VAVPTTPVGSLIVPLVQLLIFVQIESVLLVPFQFLLRRFCQRLHTFGSSWFLVIHWENPFPSSASVLQTVDS